MAQLNVATSLHTSLPQRDTRMGVCCVIYTDTDIQIQIQHKTTDSTSQTNPENDTTTASKKIDMQTYRNRTQTIKVQIGDIISIEADLDLL